jgi:hypothetical protein
MSRPAPVTPRGREADPAGKHLRELLVPDRCAVLVQELQVGVVGPISRLTPWPKWFTIASSEEIVDAWA